MRLPRKMDNYLRSKGIEDFQLFTATKKDWINLLFNPFTIWLWAGLIIIVCISVKYWSVLWDILF